MSNASVVSSDYAVAVTTKPASAGSADEPRVVLIGKPGCHLCAAARDVVVSVTSGLGIGWREESILDDASLYERYWEQIPDPRGR